MATSIHPSHYLNELNVMDHPNVTVAKDYQDVPSENRKTNSVLYHVIAPLLDSKPTWRFRGFQAYTRDGFHVFHSFNIYDDGGRLGKLSIEYFSRGYKILVANERINAKRQRGSGYRTDSAEKALLAIRKHFYRSGIAERIDKIKEQADSVLRNEASDKHRLVSKAHYAVFDEAEAFAAANLELYFTQRPHKRELWGNLLGAKEFAMVIDKVKDTFDKGKALVVVLDGEHYIVVHGKDSTTYNSDTLPFHLREKIGLLKLVEDHQMIDDVGCRVRADAFVVMPQQSEGESE